MLKKILSKILVISKIIFKIFIYLMAFCGFMSIFVRNIDFVGDCADDGGVWDDEYRVCRFDCMHWNEKDGCILRSDEELGDYVNGYCKGDGKGLHRCSMAKLELSKRQLRDEMNGLKDEDKDLQQSSQNFDKTPIDKIVIKKNLRKMYLMNGNNIIREYKISLGSEPIGAKHQENDGKTPEGQYVIETRNFNSKFHRALKISYPNDEDKKWAKEHNVSAGGDIMIHGFPNWTPNFLFNYIHKSDWTKGCIAVTDEQIEEIWALVKDGTPIEIRP